MIRRVSVALAAVVLAVLVALLAAWHMPRSERAFLPFGPEYSCAIAVTDDTDFFQFDTTTPVYALIDSLGIRVTKTVWAFDNEEHPPERAGLSLENADYMEWVLDEMAEGHEVVLHSATAGNDRREVTLEAHRLVDELVGHHTSMVIFHSTNKEAFYWGSERLPCFLLRWLYDRRTGGRAFEGDDPGSPYYWVDASRHLVRYVRGYTTDDVNTLRLCPSMPYEDPWTPDAPLWCASSNGRLEGEFVSLLSPENVRALKRENGVSIVYTHFASGFTEVSPEGRWRLTREARETLARCGTDPAVEFAPAGEVLDRLRLIQYLEDAVQVRPARGEQVVLMIPAALSDQVSNISVAPDRLPRELRAPAVGSGQSVRLGVWLDAVGWELRPSNVSVFADARRLPLKERWRLVLRWLSTSLLSPAYGYEAGDAGGPR